MLKLKTFTLQATMNRIELGKLAKDGKIRFVRDAAKTGDANRKMLWWSLESHDGRYAGFTYSRPEREKFHVVLTVKAVAL